MMLPGLVGWPNEVILFWKRLLIRLKLAVYMNAWYITVINH